MNERQVGGLIGAIGGLSFVLANAGALSAPLVWRVLGVTAFVIVLGVLFTRPGARPPTPSSKALRTYWLCVLGEVLAIPAGAALLRALDHPQLTPGWVVLVVGVHFVPFAAAFRVPMFRTLGLVLIGVALIGMIGTLAGLHDAVRIAAVGAGFVLFAAVLAGSRAGDRELSTVS
ncbi:hypothetical protein ASG90_11135 [Nocardioides sp. Soil797]|nr:hypothetical protein ASG90_11135 [Nocardioides sp. Soil797]